MNQDVAVYDIGEVGLGDLDRASRTETGARTRSVRKAPATRGEGAGPGLTGSLSLFVPGAGQILSGESVHGLFFLAGIGCSLATLSSLVGTLDRLLPTLDLLEWPRAAAGAALGSLILLAGVLHVTATVHALSLRGSRNQADPHPLVAALASALVPGWGQILVGRRARTALFLGSLWLIAVSWLAVTPTGLGVLRSLGLEVPGGARDGWGPIALVTAPVLLWALAIYDAAVVAAAQRRAA